MKTRLYGLSYFRWARSWVAFIIAMAILAAFWFGCYWVIERYTPEQNLIYFKIGAWGAGILGLLMLIFNEPIVVLTMGCVRVRQREDCPELWDAVHAVTPVLAYPVPRIYVVLEGGMNAFSFGWGLPFFSAVAATRGLIRKLDEDELKAVMAHEVGHILNKDILVSMALTITVMMTAFTGWLILRFGTVFGGSKSDSSDSKGGLGKVVAFLALLAIGLSMYIFGRLLGYILQMFVSRQREYAADATAARIMGSGRPLVAALEKIVGDPSIGGQKVGAAFGFMCAVDPQPDDLMATHPSMKNRVNALLAME